MAQESGEELEHTLPPEDLILDGADQLARCIQQLEDCNDFEKSSQKFASELEKLQAVFHAESKENAAKIIASMRREINTAKKTDILECLRDRLLRDLRPVQLRELLGYAEQNIQAKDKLQGRELTVLIGPTGVGKSLAIHFLAGSKLEASGSGITVKEAAPGTEKVRASHFARSETTVAHAVSVTAGNSQLMIVDTPGTGDTRGPEVSISTGLGMVRALQSAKAVKLWLVISRMMLEDVRLVQLSCFLQAVTQLSTDCSGSLHAFSYLFTNYRTNTSTERHNINERFRRFLLDSQNLDSQVAAIAKDIFRKTGGYFFHPEQPKMQDYIGDFFFTDGGTCLKHIQMDGKKVNGKPVRGDWSGLYSKLRNYVFAGVYLVSSCELEGHSYFDEFAEWQDAVVLIPTGKQMTDRKALLSRIRDDDSLIDDPQKFFRTMISNDVMGQFRQQLEITQDEVINLIERKRYKHACQQLQLLSELVSTLSDSTTSQGEAGKLVLLYYQKVLKQIVAGFQQRRDLIWGQINERWLDNNPISNEKHFKEYNEFMQDFVQLRTSVFRTKNGDISVLHHATELEVVEKSLISSVLSEQTRLRSLVCQLSDLSADSTHILDRLQKLKLHAQFVQRPDLKEHFENARNHVDRLLLDLVASGAQLVEGDLSVATINAACNALQTLTIYASGPDLGLSIGAAQKGIAEAFSARIRNVQTVACNIIRKNTKQLALQSEIQIVTKCLTVLDAGRACEIPEVKAVVSEAQQEVLSAVNSYYRELGNSVSQLLNNLESDVANESDPVVKAFCDCKEIIIEMDELISQLKCPKELLEDCVEKLCHHLKKLRSDTSENLQKFLAAREVSMVLFLQGLRRLRALEWMTRPQGEGRRYHRSEYASLLDEFTQELEEAATKHLSTFHCRIKQMRVTDLELLPVICNTIKALEGFEPLKEFLPKLNSQGRGVATLCEKLLEQVQKVATDGVPSADTLQITEPLDLDHLHQISIFLKACSAMNLPDDFLSEIGALQASIVVIQKKYGQLLGKRIDELFVEITSPPDTEAPKSTKDQKRPRKSEGQKKVPEDLNLEEPGDDGPDPVLVRKRKVDELFALFRRALDGHQIWPDILDKTCRPATAGLPGQWQVYLTRIETELHVASRAGQASAKLRYTANVLLDLSCLDLYMQSALSFLKHPPSREEKPFGTMFLKYQEALQKNVSFALEQAEKALYAQNYSQVKQRLISIRDNPHEFETFKQTLESFVQLKVNDLTSKLFTFRYYPGRDAQAREIVDTLKEIAIQDTQLRDLRKLLDEVLDEDTRFKLTELENSVGKGFNNVFKEFVSRCSGLVTLPDYTQAEEILAVIDSMTKALLASGYTASDTLGEYYRQARAIITEDLLEREKSYAPEVGIRGSKQQASDEGSVLIQETPVEIFGKIFAVRPPVREFLQMLDAVSLNPGARRTQSTHVPYSQSSARICSYIETNFNKSLHFIGEELDAQKQKNMVGDLKGLMRQLPVSLSHLEEKCRQYLAEMEASQQAYHEEVSKLILRDAFHDMVDVLKKSKDRRDVRTFTSVSNHLKTRATRRIDAYEKALTTNRIEAFGLLREILDEESELERAEPLYGHLAADACASFLQIFQNAVDNLAQYADQTNVLDYKLVKTSLENIEVLIDCWGQLDDVVSRSASSKSRTAGSRPSRNPTNTLKQTPTLESLNPGTVLDILAHRIDSIQAELEHVLKGASPAVFCRVYAAVSDSQFILQQLRTCIKKALRVESLAKSLEAYVPRVMGSNNSNQIGLSLPDAQEKIIFAAQVHHEVLTQSLLNKAPNLPSQLQREQFVAKYRESFAFLTALLATKLPEITTDIQKKFEASVMTFREQLQTLVSNLTQMVAGHLTEDVYQSLDAGLGLLRVFSEKLDHTTSPARDAIASYDAVLKEYTRSVTLKQESAFKAHERGLELSLLLIELKTVSVNVPVFRKVVDDATLAIFQRVQKDSGREGLLRQIVVELRGNAFGRQIVAEQPSLKGFENEMRNQRTLSVTVESAVQTLTGDAFGDGEKAAIERCYEQIIEKYWNVVEDTDKPNGSITKLVQQIKEKGTRMRTKQKNKALLLEVLPLLFALWTVLKSGHYVGENKDAIGAGNRNFYKKPHPVQVICVLRLLGLDEEQGWWKYTGETLGFLKSAFQGHLAQVGTGEGKSVILAILACCFALQGFRVDCACYSEYLGDRDYKEFFSMFNALGIEGNIKYGTFQVLCEEIVNGSGSVRENVENLLLGRPIVRRNMQREDAEGRILLVDEVDVFLSEFLAEPYAMQTQWKDNAILDLLKLVWSCRASPRNVRSIMESPQYQKLLKKFPAWEFLLRGAVHDMMAVVQDFSNPSYTVQNDKIGYTRQDATSFTQLEGYKTVFAYFYEHERGQVSDKARDKFASIFVRCGIFSYALIPKKYALILGVTGTLRELSMSQSSMIRNEYSVAKFTYLPSAYGPSQCSWFCKSDKHLQLKSAPTQEEHFRQIAIEMNQRVTEVQGVRRPIIVVLRDAKQVHAFKGSPQLSNFFSRSPVNILTETSSSEEKASVVSKATMCGNVTLITRNFGRGTDFVCYDEKADKAGGLHVLLTFFPTELAEEVQIRGRTARQGQAGSFSMVLSLEQTASQLELTVDQLRAKAELPETLYNELHTRRLALFEVEQKKREELKVICCEEHKRTESFVFALGNGEIEKCLLQLRTWNQKVGNSASRTIVLMDATGSMEGLLNNCKVAVKQMFDRAYDILQKANKSDTKFELCMAVYRNYGIGPQYLLENSEWTAEPTSLQVFLNGIKPRGGQGREAVEVGLAFANKEREFSAISQVVVIGDMPPNTKNEVAERRRGGSWQNTQFEKPTFYQTELEILRQAHIPVHAFWVHKNAEQSFREIAQATGGECAFLDVNGGEAGVALLTHCITRRVLASTGGAKLIALYDSIYARQGASIGK